MVKITQIQHGITRFVDTEIVPSLSIMEKVVVGGGAGVVTAKLPNIIDTYADHKVVTTLGLYDKERQEIDLDAVYNAAKPYIGPDPIPVTIPGIGLTLKFTQREIDTLYKYIKEA